MQTTVDPARDAASVLRRLGFVALVAGLPLGALLSRNGSLIALAIGVALIVIAAGLDGAARPLRPSLARLAENPLVLVLAVLVGWSLLSLVWTPQPRAGAIPSNIAVLLLGLAALLTLPDRMRAANLYVVPVGAAAAALVMIGLALLGGPEPEDGEGVRRTERGLAVALMLAWPGIGWLRSRGRHVEASALGVLAALAAGLAGPNLVPLLAFGLGGLAFLLAQAFGRRGASATGYLLAALVALAPALLLLGQPLLAKSPALAPWASALEPWRADFARAPARLLTGHGLGALRFAADGLRDLRTPGAPLLALWWELGAVGALALAASFATVLRPDSSDFKPVLPSLAGAVATAFGLAVGGVDGAETWWFATLALVAIAFVGAERGQFRTRRPRLNFIAGRTRG